MSFSADLSPLLLHGSKAGNSYDDPGTIWVTTGPLRNVQQRGGTGHHPSDFDH
jgi:hypothetical protein